MTYLDLDIGSPVLPYNSQFLPSSNSYSNAFERIISIYWLTEINEAFSTGLYRWILHHDLEF